MVPQASSASFGVGSRSRISSPPVAGERDIEDVVDAVADEQHSGDAMDDAAPLLAQAEGHGEPGVGILQREAGDDQDEEAGEQNQVLPALVGASCASCWAPSPGGGPWLWRATE